MAFAEPMSRKTPAEPVDRYLGVDPGLNRTGYALIERTPGGPCCGKAASCGPRGPIPSPSGFWKSDAAFREMIEEYQPQLMAVEQVFSFGRNPKTALLMAHAARGNFLGGRRKTDSRAPLHAHAHQEAPHR